MAEIKSFPVGLIYFGEEFGAFLEERMNAEPPFENENGELVKLKAEHMAIHEVNLDFEPTYSMIIDRASHYFKHSMGVFMMNAFKGVQVVNNPMSFHYFIANKDLGFYVAHQLGVNVPPTYVLPPKENKYLKNDEDFKHHKVFDWHKMVSNVEFPCFLKPAEGRAAFDVNEAQHIEELWSHYDQSGDKVMTLQQKVKTPYDWQVRCICVGRTIIPIKYVFRDLDGSEYIYDEDFLTEEQGQKVIDMARVINRAFGYEMNSVEFFIGEDGEPYAIDFNNPVPDGRRDKLGEVFFQDYANAFVKLAKEGAIRPRKSPYLPLLNEYAEIGRRDISKEERFKEALALANNYYLEFE